MTTLAKTDRTAAGGWSAWLGLVAALTALLAPPALANPASFVPTDPVDETRRVEFPSAAAPSKRHPKTPARIAGYLYRPEGKGPFPALVLLHGCAGIMGQPAWAQRLASWGYVALIVDHHGPRGEEGMCAKGGYRLPVPSDIRVADAYGALRYLAAQPYVDPARIGLMGWSVVASASPALLAVESNPRAPDTPAMLVAAYAREDRFRTVVALYPLCPTKGGKLQHLEAPIYAPALVLSGADDFVAPAEYCRVMAEQSKASGKPVRARVYEGAGHGFDHPAEGLLDGQLRVRYSPEAARAAIEEVKAYLAGTL